MTTKTVLQHNRSFVLTTHLYPDGDGVGSIIALAELLIRLGKTVSVAFPSPVPDKYLFLDSRGLFGGPIPDFFDVLVALDVGRADRLGSLELLLADHQSLCIDHHPLTTPFTTSSYIDESACATGVMIYSLFVECGVPLTKEAAAGIYVSILSDTGRFCNSSTDARAHKVADICITAGIDPDKIYSALYQHVPLSEMKALLSVMQRMETYLDNRVVIQEIRLDDSDISHIDLDYVLEFDKSIDGVECVVLLRELPDSSVRISMRSKSDFDMSALMRQIGGGGHQKAAGALIKGSLAQAKQLVLQLLESYFVTR